MVYEKFKKLVHYVIAKCDDPSKLGATKLNKIAWFSDSFSYRMSGVAITTETYLKRQHGPVPKHILQVLRELEGDKAIVIRERDHFGYLKREYVAVAEPDTSLFSAKELEIVDDVIAGICNGHTATSISDLSHDQIWDAAQLGEEIPLTATLAAIPGEIDDKIMEWASSVVEAVEKRKQTAA